MRTEVHVHGNLYLCEGVTRRQVEAALRPWLEYLDVERMDEAKSLEPDQPGIVYHARDGLLEICWTGAVGRTFEQKLEETVQLLGPLTEQAAELELTYYHENGGDETRLIFVGPTPEAIHEAQRRRMVEDVASLLSRHFDEAAVGEVVALVNDLFRREWQSGGREAPAPEPSMPSVPPGRKHLH
ncbi:DUF6806 family protein [Pelomicrobium methylotrophicum]|uniref:Uncharacterized protein n=1 Tax=Pelomicrobium methylotrophicum TaxID=2602750 RepID=A0A5C7EQA4_9PROT|nr:DUF6806 family protein [Pelomicrobium methylotrophicum]TXF10683.1 hypothetical protein FR698_14170 [Pelomicrobium methylotrophicum]